MASETITVEKALLTELLDAYRAPFGFRRLKAAVEELETIVKESETESG